MNALNIDVRDLRPAMVWLKLKKKMTQNDIAKLFEVNKNTVSKVVKNFKEQGNFDDKPRSGRPKTATDDAHLQKMEDELAKDDHSLVNSTRKLAVKLRVSPRSIRRMLQKNGYRSWKEQKRHFLSEPAKKKRRERCRALLKRCDNDGYKNILFSDEKLFTVEQAYNRQNDRIWSKRVPLKSKRVRQRVMKPKSVMVWAGVGHNMKTPLVFIPEGVKVNQLIYRNLLRKEVRPWMRKNQLDFTFQQDGATSHTAKETQRWCKRNFENFIPKDEWPPYSPDLTPLDYSIWSILEQRACVSAHKNIKSLTEALQVAWGELDQNIINKAVAQFPTRLQACIDAEGAHFE
jgi:transposase